MRSRRPATAFEGPWRTTSPADRQRLLWKVADVLEEHYAELKVLTAADMGSPAGRDPSMGATGATDAIRYFAGWATKISGATLPNSVPGMFTYTRKEPIGVVGAYVPFNSPFTQFVKKLGAVLATGCTMVVKPADQASLTILRGRGALHGGGDPRRRAQRDHRWPGRGRRDRGAPRRRQHRVHRLDDRRPAARPCRRRQPQAAHARARREVAAHRLRRRRPRARGADGHDDGVRELRSGLLERHADLRRAPGVRRGRRGLRADGRRAEDGQQPRPRDASSAR